MQNPLWPSTATVASREPEPHSITLMTAIAATSAAVHCYTILNTTLNVRGLSTGRQRFRTTEDSTARMLNRKPEN